jgi:hypothetical protein
MTTTYPHLGFDPSPGSVESVNALRQKVDTAAQSMVKANELMNQLRNTTSGVWQGPAGDSFRSHLNSTLIEDLSKANQSLNEAVTALKGWSGNLSDYKARSDELESQAAEAAQRLTEARSKARAAADNPDFGLANRMFDTQEALQAAQDRLNNAADALQRANDTVTAADDELQAIRKKARDLNDEWDEASSKVAGALRHAAEWAPHKPGLLSRIGQGLKHAVDAVGDWVSDHLDDIHAVLSSIAAVAGVIALFTPPPIDAVAAVVGVVAGAGALATSLADPKVRGNLGELLHGDFSKDNLKSAGQVVGDGLSLIPGGGIISGLKGLGKAATAAEAAGEAIPTVTTVLSDVAKNAGVVSKQLAKLPLVGELGSKLAPVGKAAEDGVVRLYKPIMAAKTTIKSALGFGDDDS